MNSTSLAPRHSIRTEGLTKTFGSFYANRNVSLSIPSGTIHGLLGENGAGKSTFLKMLFGIYKPSAGKIFVNEKEVQWRSPLDAIQSGLGMVQQHFALVESLSALDNIILGAEPVGPLGQLDRESALKKILSLLPSKSLEVPWHEPMKNLGVGDRQRVEILKLLYRETQILFLDEPTAVLTPQEIDDLMEVLRLLKSSGKTIVFVSHKIPEILALCDNVSVLRRGESVWTKPISEVTRDSLVEAIVGRPLEPTHVPAKQNTSTKAALSFQNVKDVAFGRDMLRGISFDLRPGEILGVAGVSGSGQRSLIDMIMGLKKYEGSIQLLGREVGTTKAVRSQGVSLIPEERLGEGLWGEESVAHNVIAGLEEDFQFGVLKTLGIFDEGKIQKVAADWTQKFDVRLHDLDQPSRSLSGGNQQKLIFAREILGRKPKVLLCFNPTRGVDLGAIHSMHLELLRLRAEGVAILYISHELDELVGLCDRILVLCEGELTALLDRPEFSRERIGQAMGGVKA